MDSTKQKLVATIYAATLSPTGFKELVADLTDQLADLIRELTGLENVDKTLPRGSEHVFDQSVIADLMEHVRTAHSIQSRIGHFDNADGRAQLVVDAAPNPAVVFDGHERVVAANSLAVAQYGTAATLAQLFGNRDELASIRKAVGALGRKTEFASVPLTMDFAHVRISCALTKRVQPASREENRSDMYLLAISNFGFDENVRANFRDTYDLTDAEASVAVLLASGTNPEEIAVKRAVSLKTVRTQIKSIKHKTGVRDLPHLIRLLCGYAAGILVPGGAQSHQSVLVRGLSATSATFTLSDDRRMEYLEQGAPGGRPVLLLHNLPYGLVLPEAAIRAATARGIRIIAPFRPGQGRSDPLPGVARENLLNRVASDLNELLAHLDIASVKVLGNVGGSSYAIRFASLFPQKVSDILMISRAPIWRGEWLAGLPRQQKLLSMLLRDMPPPANVVVWAILSYVNRQDGGDFLRQSLKESEADLRALDDPETVRLVADGITFGLEQGPEAFCRDWEAMEIDMTREARLLPQRMHIIQGAEDRITRPMFSAAFVEEVPAATREVVEGAGNLLFYSHWRRVVDQL